MSEFCLSCSFTVPSYKRQDVPRHVTGYIMRRTGDVEASR